MERRLAAVLIADVVGYSRLSQRNEEGTRASFRADLGEVFEPTIAGHRGRLIKTLGDGVLVEFPSVVDAVRCAIDIQRNKAARNTGVAMPLLYRIGINLGDIIIEGADIHGDGVNIADRIQGLADHGGIALSGAAYDQVKSKIDIGFAFLGERELKNIAEPVRLYRVVLGPADAAGTIDAAATKKADLFATGAGASDSRLSIAILPFTNMSGDKEQDYFSDGITEDIITEVSRFREIRVIARNSSFAFRGQNVDISEIGRRLGVQFVVEGSVRKASNRVRITVQLIEAETNRHVWAERYDRDLDDVFAVQDEIAHTIAGLSAGYAKLAAVARIKTRPTDSLSAYDMVLRSRATLRHYGNHYENATLLEKVIALDPNYALAHALMANSLQQQSLYEADVHKRERAAEYARRAIQLDPAEPFGHAMLGYCLTFLRRWPEASVHYERALELNPNDTYIVMLHALSLVYLGEVDRAITRMQYALARDPYAHDWFWDDYLIALVVAGRYKDALVAFEKIAVPPFWSCYYVAIAHLNLGDMESAIRFLRRFNEASPEMPAEVAIGDEPFADLTVPERLLADIRRIMVEADEGRSP